MATRDPLHWLELQRRTRYAWSSLPESQGEAYYRRLGVVENLFTADGQFYTGRADLHMTIRFELKTTLDDRQLEDRIILAWTLMRHEHILLSTTIERLTPDGRPNSTGIWTDNCFVYRRPSSRGAALAECQKQSVFVANHYPNVDLDDFRMHIRNTARAINPTESLSKLYVLPFQRTAQGTVMLILMPVLAHCITDGITAFRWSSILATLLNIPSASLYTRLSAVLSEPPSALISRLPPPQEALYPLQNPTSAPNSARERWHWVITRILRHVRRPNPVSFQNPMRRSAGPVCPSLPPRNYPKVLNYTSGTPSLNSGLLSASLTGRAAENLARLCKDAKISTGSGLFTFVGMIMMYFYEKFDPEVPLSQRLPFTGGFPVNPRPWLSQATTGKEDSMMLAFSDGVVLPFLSKDLDLKGRFRVLGRQAHRQLRIYQKRAEKEGDKSVVQIGSRSPRMLLPLLACGTTEWMEMRARTTEGDNMGAGLNVQGDYPAKTSGSLSTCGISSVGDMKIMMQGLRRDLKGELDAGEDLRSDYLSTEGIVRPREGEWLTGAWGLGKEYFEIAVAYDACIMNPERVKEWKDVLEGMLDVDLFGESIAAKM